MFDAHVQQREYLLQGLVMFTKPDRFGHYRFAGNYRPELCRRIINKEYAR